LKIFYVNSVILTSDNSST